MKKILITGAGSGIGKAAAFALAQRGHAVIATTETQVQADALVVECAKQSLTIEIWKLDITKASDRAKIVGRNIDTLINNAAIGESGSLAEVPLDLVRNSFEVNVLAPVALSQLILKEMVARKSGRVLFVSSLAGRVPMLFLNPYSMTKFALSGGVAALRQEMYLLSPHIHVSLIEPGPFATGFNEAMLTKKYTWMDTTSMFYPLLGTIKDKEQRWLRGIQKTSIKSIIKKIIKAVEADTPSLRYTSPLSHGLGVQLARIIGR